jgi:hypothetical protein
VKSGAGAYVSSEAANAERMLVSAVIAPAQRLGVGAQVVSQSITSLETEAAALTNGLNTFSATIAAPVLIADGHRVPASCRANAC